MSKSVWGVDVSKCSVKCVRLEKTRDGIVLTDLDVIEYAKPMTGEEANVDQQIREALTLFKERNRAAGVPVLCSLPGHSTFNRLIKLPPVDEAKCREIAQYEAQSQIPFPIEEVIWDYQLIQRDYAANEEKEIILFAIKKEVVEQFLGNIRPADLNIEAVQFAPVALYNFLVHDQDLGSAFVALDIGADNTDLILIDGLKLWIRNLPITGNDFTKAIQKSFNVSFDEAERIKVSAAQSQNAPKIYAAVQPVMKDLVGEIHRSLGYYKSIAKSVRFEKIILMGNASRTIHFQKFISQSLQLTAVQLSQVNTLGLGPGLDQNLFQRYLPTMGGALGLALQGLDTVPNRINLLPQRFTQERKIKKKQPIVAAILACLTLWLAAMYFTTKAQITKMETRAMAPGQEALKRYQGNLDLYKKHQAELKKQQSKLDFFRSVTADRDLALNFLNELNAIMQRNDEKPQAEPWSETDPAAVRPIVTDIVFEELDSFQASRRRMKITVTVLIKSATAAEGKVAAEKIFNAIAKKYGLQADNENGPTISEIISYEKEKQRIDFREWNIVWVVPERT